MGEFDWTSFIESLWDRENAQGKRGIEGKGGFRGGKYYPYITPNGDTDIGPGFDLSKQTPAFRERAKKGFTRKELDAIIQDRLQNERYWFNQRIAKEGGNPSALTDNVYTGLLDMYWQLGNGLYGYDDFWKAVAKQDYKGMQEEAKTYYGPKGNKKLDEGRWNFRKEQYFKEPDNTNTPSITRYLEISRDYLQRQLEAQNKKQEEAKKALVKGITFIPIKVAEGVGAAINAGKDFVKKYGFSEGGFLKPKDAWDALSMKDKADMIGIAVKHGITSLSDIRDKYNEFTEGGDTDPMEYTQQRFPVTKEFDITPYKDPSFTPEGMGNIEYMSAEHDTLPYYNNYQKPSNLKGKSVVVYNDKMGNATNEAIALDILSHGLREQDPTWRRKYLPTLTDAFEGDAIYNMTDEDRKIYNLNDPEDRGEVIDNYIDGYIRAMAVDDKYRKALNYAPRSVFNKEYNALPPEQQNALAEAYSYIYPTILPDVTVYGKKHSIGGPLIEGVVNEYKNGGYKPSENIKKRISRWEGDAMVKDTIDPLSGKMAKKNRPFEEVTRGFVRALPSSIAERVLSNPELADNLYSYAYNVGPGNFKKRVVPVLQRYYNGDATVDDVTSSMWASGDKKLRGLRNRRAEEKAGVRNALLGHAATSTVLEPATPALVATNNYVSNPYPLLTEEVQPTPLFYHIEDRSTDISPSPEELERQERREALDRFNTVMSLIGIKNPLTSYTSDTGNSFLDTLGLFTNENADGGKIHIKPSHRGRLTELKKGTGKTEAELYRTGSPATRKMITFARNARKWKHGLGGNLFDKDANIYGLGDWLKKGINKSRRVVSSLGLDKSPAQHFIKWVTSDDNNKKQDSKIAMKPEENNNLGFWSKNAIVAARALGLNDRYKGEEKDTLYRRNIFNQIDPTTNVPRSIGEMLEFARTAERAKSKEQLPYIRKYQNPSAEAAWAKRLGLPYDSTLLISNSDGSVHLSKQLEDEMPTDTILLKNRIASNEKKLNNIYGPHKKVIEAALDFDRGTLSALRETYKTGKPVTIDEHSYNTRDWRGKKPEDITPTPLSLLHRYTFQYDKDNNAMNYWDTYNFDEYEDFVPGKPFFIKGSIDLNKRK